MKHWFNAIRPVFFAAAGAACRLLTPPAMAPELAPASVRFIRSTP